MPSTLLEVEAGLTSGETLRILVEVAKDDTSGSETWSKAVDELKYADGRIAGDTEDGRVMLYARGVAYLRFVGVASA